MSWRAEREDVWYASSCSASTSATLHLPAKAEAKDRPAMPPPTIRTS
jgi:hypothetical protein